MRTRDAFSARPAGVSKKFDEHCAHVDARFGKLLVSTDKWVWESASKVAENGRRSPVTVITVGSSGSTGLCARRANDAAKMSGTVMDPAAGDIHIRSVSDVAARCNRSNSAP
jgi:hypothetical protein